jgi:hypothetical protein
MGKQQNQVTALLRLPNLPIRMTSRQQQNPTLIPLFLGIVIFLQVATFLVVLYVMSEPAAGSGDPVAADRFPEPVTPQRSAASLLPPTSTTAAMPARVADVPGAARDSQSETLWLRGIETTQGIQVFNEPESARCVPDAADPNHIFCNNSLPMVAGRHTMVRVYLGCNKSCPAGDVTVLLRAVKDGQEVAQFSDIVPTGRLQSFTGLAMTDLRAELDNSVNFSLIPAPTWLRGDVTFHVEVILATSTAAVVQATARHDFVVRPPLRVAYLPVGVKGNQPDDPDQAAYWLLRMFPVPAVTYERIPAPGLSLSGDVEKGALLRRLLYTYWFYAQSQSAVDRPDQLFGWLPQQAFNGGVSDPVWCADCAGPRSGRVAFGGLRPERSIGGPRILVHEIAHNLGAHHAWSPTYSQDNACFKTDGADIKVDPDWPYHQSAFIQEFGIDLYSDPPVIYSPTSYDVMAYCEDPWISPFTYLTLFNSPLLQEQAVSASSLAGYQLEPATNGAGTLLVSGVIFPNGSVAKPDIIKLPAGMFGSAGASSQPFPLTPPAGSDYCLEIFAAGGEKLEQYCFDAGFADLETGYPTEPGLYFFALPGINLETVAQVSVSYQGAPQITVSASNSPPQLTLTSLPNEIWATGQSLTWQATDADSDPLVYDLFYSLDSGAHWLPLALRVDASQYTLPASHPLGSGPVQVRVLANDGFYTTSREVQLTVLERND